MINLPAYDFNGDSADILAQWDKDVYIYVRHDGLDQAYPVHFCNSSLSTAYVVNSTIEPDGRLKVKVPNDLLVDSLGITAFIYVPIYGGVRSIYRIRISIIKRPAPEDFVYEPSSDYISIMAIRQELIDLIKTSNTPGVAGADGGYYIPAIDGNGNLTWTASKSSMEKISPTNIRGSSGGYYTPKIDQNGLLSWEPSAPGMPHIVSVNIKGRDGVDGLNGRDGADGRDGVNGADGRDGRNGITPKIKIGQTKTLSPGSQATVTLSGTTEEPILTFGIPAGMNGSGSGGSGTDGGYYVPSIDDDGNLTFAASRYDMPEVDPVNIKGANGKTPIKGVDYFTTSDIQQIVSSVISSLPKYSGGVS